MTATLKWMNGDCFEECSDAAGGSEYDGILARVLRRTHLMLKQLDLAFQLFLGLLDQRCEPDIFERVDSWSVM